MGVGVDDISSKLLSFRANGVTVFQGARIGVTKQLQTQYTPFMIGVLSPRIPFSSRVSSSCKRHMHFSIGAPNVYLSSRN
jgi:hypothetical protein